MNIIKNETTIKIGNRTVGKEHPPLVIAEVGINHEGSIDKAFAMVDAGAAAGAEIIKFQCHITEKEMVPTDMTPGDISDERLWDIIKRCELTEDEERKVQAYCETKGVLYLSTPFSREAADRLDDMGVPAFKIGSGECNNIPLIEHIAAKGKPIIMSTGMNGIESVRKSVKAIKKHGCELALLHCVSMYPTPYENVNLGAITDLQENFPDLLVGLSDHSLNIWTCLGGVALGASILEKHFTVSRSWSGPDTPISIEPSELADLIMGSKAVWQATGGNMQEQDAEQPVKEFANSTVVSIMPIKAGEIFSMENIWVKRPGAGAFPAAKFEEILGRRASRNVKTDEHLVSDDIEGGM